MVAVTFTFGHINPKPGFVSAWDAAKGNYDKTFGAGAFDGLSRTDQISEVRMYVSR
jgi:hypothetical protein